MSKNFAKFVLVGVLIVVVILSRKDEFGYESVVGAIPSQLENFASETKPTPIFKMYNPERKKSGGDLPAQTATLPLEFPAEKPAENLFAVPRINFPALITENILSGVSGKTGGKTSDKPVLLAKTVASGGVKGGQTTDAIFAKKNDLSAPVIFAQAALLADLQTGETYFELNSRRQWPIASISKLVTAAVAFREIDLSQNITLSAEDFLIDDNAVNKNLKIGETINGNDLLKTMLLVSSNEAAEAFARVYGRDNFVALMNSYAKENQMESTFFKDPTGLSVSNQSTPQDLRLLASAILKKQPEIFKITQTPGLEFQDAASGSAKTAININQFAGQADFVGGKTGYIDESGENLLSVFNLEGRRIFVVVLGAGDRFGETRKLLQWLEEAYRLNVQ